MQLVRVLFVSVPVVVPGGCRVVEVAGRTNRALTRIGPRKSGGLIPVQMANGVRVFGVGLGQLASEDLLLLLLPGRPQGLDRSAALGVGFLLSNALVQRDLVLYVGPRLEVARGRVVGESRPHRRRHEVELVHGCQTEDLLDRSSHVDLRVVIVLGRSILHGVWADDITWAAMTVNVVDAVLRVVFLDEDRRRGPDWAVADVVDNAPNRQIVIGFFGLHRRRAAGVVAHYPQHA